MNKLEIKSDYLWVDDECLNSIFEKIHGSDNFFEWLVSSICVENTGELDYIHELIKRKISCNFPVLVCGDDLDFSCEKVVVKTIWTEKTVIWTKFGTVKGSINYWEKYRNSGIRKVENWTDNDWSKYGSIAYDLLYDENFFDSWCSENWHEEVYRRTWGYYHEYFNNDLNIDWIGEVAFTFDSEEYQNVFLR
ncbi:MAG: hypothetical protein NC177_14430 [Ruminococcus flavefaciens]|nr:hypothetical protein [Ruminococcus flavefaciens]